MEGQEGHGRVSGCSDCDLALVWFRTLSSSYICLSRIDPLCDSLIRLVQCTQQVQLLPLFSALKYSLQVRRPDSLFGNMKIFKRSPEKIMEIYIPEKPLLQAASALTFEVNCALATLRSIALERDIKNFALVEVFLVSLVFFFFCCYITL